MEDYSSDEDVELAAYERAMPQPRTARKFEERQFVEEDPTASEQKQKKNFRERYRVPKEVVDFLEDRLSPDLLRKTNRNKALTPRQQILTFLHFLGCNSLYHDLRDIHGIGTDTVMRCVHRVADLIFGLRQEVIAWPENPQNIAQEFYELGGMPCVCGAVDGTHVLINPPREEENSYVNRHHTHSINAVMCCGPDLRIYYANSKAPGSWHDSHVLRETSMWETFEAGNRPFPGAVVLGDSAYALRDWLITPYPGNPEGAKLKFNNAHIQTRNVIERCFGVLKNRFLALKSVLRVHDMELAAKLIICAAVLHNLCLTYGDDMEDLEDSPPPPQAAEEVTNGPAQEARRQQLLRHFMT